MNNFFAEASSQARGYTRCGSELIVNEIATGTSNISQEDAYQNALKLAQQKADTTLKEEILKIDRGNAPCIMLRGRDGLPGSKGKRGEKGDQGSFPFALPSYFLGGTSFVIPTNLLTQEQIDMLGGLANEYSLTPDNTNTYTGIPCSSTSGIVNKYNLDVIDKVFSQYPDTTSVNLDQRYGPFTTNFSVTDVALATIISDFISWLRGNHDALVPFLLNVRITEGSTDTDAVGGVGYAQRNTPSNTILTFSTIFNYLRNITT